MGGIAFKESRYETQLMGCIIGSIAIFLPAFCWCCSFFLFGITLKNMQLFTGRWKVLMPPL
jgi:hypothetical protein